MPDFKHLVGQECLKVMVVYNEKKLNVMFQNLVLSFA